MLMMMRIEGEDGEELVEYAQEMLSDGNFTVRGGGKCRLSLQPPHD